MKSRVQFNQFKTRRAILDVDIERAKAEYFARGGQVTKLEPLVGNVSNAVGSGHAKTNGQYINLSNIL